MFVTTTVAQLMTVPLESLTTPKMLPSGACPGEPQRDQQKKHHRFRAALNDAHSDNLNHRAERFQLIFIV
jgi:hypothetical protein